MRDAEAHMESKHGLPLARIGDVEPVASAATASMPERIRLPNGTICSVCLEWDEGSSPAHARVDCMANLKEAAYALTNAMTVLREQVINARTINFRDETNCADARSESEVH